ncbi:MAG TPA: DUF58 domain-containing protein, partial [Pseudonocardiaceae bacterium]
AGSAAAWVAGVRLGWVELVLVAAVGLTALLCGVLLTVGRANLRVAVQLRAHRVIAGGGTDGAVTVTTPARRRLLPVTVELPVGEALRRFDVPVLGGGHAHRAVFTVDTERRGVIPIGPATTVNGDPFGLLRRAVPWTGVVELFVHPVTVPLEPLGSGLLRDLEGRTTTDISMSDLAFHTLREYVPGDDRRHIHWRSSARAGSVGHEGKLLVRQFLDTRRACLMVAVDGDPASYRAAGDVELAISAGASVALRAIRDELDTTAVVADQVAHGMPAHLTLDRFARATPGPLPLNELVARGLRAAPAVTTAFVVTGPLPGTTDVRRALTQLPPEVNAVVLRVDGGAPAAVSAIGDLTVLTLGALTELPPLLRPGGTR